MAVRIYLAGGLFNAGERIHNLYLEKHLQKLGYEVILPQREAKKFQVGDSFDVGAIVRDCQQSCTQAGTILVGCIDGPDADSGTAVEFGMALTATGRAIIYRTDFRTAEDHEVGVNAMFRAPGATMVYEPSFVTELDQIDEFYLRLARRLHTTILALTDSKAADDGGPGR